MADRQGPDKEGGPDQSQDASMAEFKSRFIGVFTNPTWICLTVFAFCDNFIIAGYTAFGPKLVEVLFAMSATMAGTLFGTFVLCSVYMCFACSAMYMYAEHTNIGTRYLLY